MSMAPQKFSSVRHRTRPTSMKPFRDDSLVAFRYEQTIQLEPPIPIPPRNPLRNARPFSTISGCNTIIMVPPPSIAPNEQHPALRTHVGAAAGGPCSPTVSDASSKRDSGVAATSSSATIREEESEDIVVIFSKFDEYPYSSSCSSPSSEGFGRVALSDVRCTTPSRSETSEIRPPRTPPAPRSTTPPLPRKLVKSFSFRSGVSMTRLRKKSLGEEIDDRRSACDGSAPSRAPGTTSPKRASRAKSPPVPADAAPAATGDGACPGIISTASDSDFSPLTIPIPTESLLDDDFLSQLSFSKRGSIMLGGKRPFPGLGFDLPQMESLDLDGAGGSQSQPPASELASQSMDASATTADGPAPDAKSLGDDTQLGGQPKVSGLLTVTPSIRILSAQVERESQKVRSLYESGESLDWEEEGRRASPPPSGAEPLEPAAEVPSSAAGDENDASPSTVPPPPTIITTPSDPPFPASATTPISGGSSPRPPSSAHRRGHELAGGIEDWQDIEVSNVDRYGFIREQSSSRPVSSAGTTASDSRHSAFSPRKRNVLIKRDFQLSPLMGRSPSRKVSARSLNTQASEMSNASRRSARSSIRAATNLLPHNRERRWMDEAGDMLTLPPGLADIAEDEKVEKIGAAIKQKEWERSEKWRKMATIVKKGSDGEGMDFAFDVRHPKLVERTWKGIPDRWRAAAWYSFLASSAGAGPKSTAASDEQLVAEYKRLQDVSSPDDVQIDLDVPRTINRHIMFRKRYRGGQRLLFRVLHAISLYFPDTGYVQGMASLAATLLNYYDEEKCFVMMVRMWQLRGLERLYEPGFDNLMAALKDFERTWLDGKEVSRRLAELGIDSTAYGTRWYLTLFSLSIPFPAQLRVWDVFMLLGGNPVDLPTAATAASEATPPPSEPPSQSSGTTGSSSAPSSATPAAAPASTSSTDSQAQRTATGFDILHATSAALFHALNEVLVDSDFENAMKALTSYVPIKDEDMLMRVTKAEWKLHRGNRKKT